LVLARRARLAGQGKPSPDGRSLEKDEVWNEVEEKFKSELAPHFDQEESILLPAMKRAGEEELVEETLRQHREIRSCLVEDGGDLASRLLRFGELLDAHVRFEERTLFEVAERTVDRAAQSELIRVRQEQ